MDKVDIAFDAAMFSQHFDLFSPAYGPHFAEIFKAAPTRRPTLPHAVTLGDGWTATLTQIPERPACQPAR